MSSSFLTVAAGGGALVDIDPTFFIQLGIFFVMFLFLYLALFRPAVRMIEARRDATDGEKDRAKTMMEEADKLAADVDTQLAQVRVSVNEQRNRMLEEAHRQERKVLDAAREQSQNAIAEARLRMTTSAQQVRGKLKADVQGLANSVAERMLGRSL